ncbi:MAG: isoleucine--tRNA ligase, partial [Gemmatimonadales bacterium]
MRVPDVTADATRRPESSPGAPPPSWPAGSADALERQMLEVWEREGLFAAVQAATAGGAPWVFYEGPPTANGRPGIHHVASRAIKDIVCRYHAMLGQRVTRIAGWDTHGLPVELEVEKQLGFKGKADIEAFGVAEFSRRCLESVFTYRDEWVALSNRIGYWLDYDRAYVTCTRDYIESVWWLLKQLHERDLLYRGHRVLPYCPRCGTTLSSHELALGYEEVRDRAIYVALPLADGSGRELVVWTTTPWTLPSNVAIAVNPALTYATYRTEAGRLLVVAEHRAPLLEEIGITGAPVDRYPGTALVGLRYRRPLDVVPIPEGSRHSIVVAGSFVTADEGSGLVHMAPAFGADDYAAGQEFGLAMLRPVGADGAFHGTTWPELEGRLVTAAETNELIIRQLKTLGRHLRTEQHTHSYPHCWRCRSKLIYLARDSWFIRTSAFKDRMSALNAGIAWHPPEVGTGRFGEWLANNVDWALSRERYWGTPLPIWVNDRDPAQLEVIGSFEELKARAGFVPAGDLEVHKPWIDEVTWAAPDGGTMRRVPEVIDTWFDSGAMPYAQWHYPFENHSEFESHFPADYICEGVDQTRGWFYSLLAIATAVSNTAPYRNAIVNELILDASGQKMSKSRGNVVDPWDVIRDHGADAARLYLVMASQVWQPKRFDAGQLVETAGRFLRKLRDTYEFFALYAGPRGREPRPADGDTPLIDRWVLGRLDVTVRDVRAAYDGYDVTAATRAVAEFVDGDLSNWYVRLNRDRFWAPDGEPDPGAVATLEECLVTAARLLAPAAPFAVDWMHRALRGTSVHLATFPIDAGRFDPDLDRAMDAVRRLASLGRAARETAAIRVRQPLAAMRVAVPPGIGGTMFDALLPLLAAETNVKRVEVVASDASLVRLRARPNFRSLGNRFGPKVQAVAAAVSALDGEALRRFERGDPVQVSAGGETLDLLGGDLSVEREVVTDWPVASEGPFVVALDPAISAELAGEGMARELISRVQRLRRDAGYDVSTRIVLAIDGAGPVVEAARRHRDHIAHETLARDLVLGGMLPQHDRVESVMIDDQTAALAVRRWGNGRTLSGPAPSEP